MEGDIREGADLTLVATFFPLLVGGGDRERASGGGRELDSEAVQMSMIDSWFARGTSGEEPR